MHEDNFVGWCVINSLGGGDTVVKHEYLTGTLANDYHSKLGFNLFSPTVPVFSKDNILEICS